MIRVANVRGLKGPARSSVCYVGRQCFGWPAHALGNPFRVTPAAPCTSAAGAKAFAENETQRVVEEYRRWLAGRLMRDNGQALLDLWAECWRGEVPLGCWCVNSAYVGGHHLLVRNGEVTDTEVPVTCHAQVLAEQLALRFQRPEGSCRYSEQRPAVWSRSGELQVTFSGVTLSLPPDEADRLSTDLRAEIARVRAVQAAIREGVTF